MITISVFWLLVIISTVFFLYLCSKPTTCGSILPMPNFGVLFGFFALIIFWIAFGIAKLIH